MKCVSYDYEFESDLATKWNALDHSTTQRSGRTKRLGMSGKNYRQQRGRRQQSTSDDSEDEGGALTATTRDPLPRKARRETNKLEDADEESAESSDSEDQSDEDDDGPYHDATGELLDQ